MKRIKRSLSSGSEDVDGISTLSKVKLVCKSDLEEDFSLTEDCTLDLSEIEASTPGSTYNPSIIKVRLLPRQSPELNFGPLDVQVLKMICKENYSFSFMENEAFKNVIKLLNPSYTLPNKKTLSSSLLNHVYNETMKKVKVRLKNAKNVSLIFHRFVNSNNVSIYSITSHYFNEQTSLQSHFLSCAEFQDNDESNDLPNWFEQVTKEFRIDSKISCVVTENIFNLKNTVLALQHGHLPCYAHSLNLVVQDAINNNIKELVDNIRNIVQFFKKDSNASAKLVDMHIELNKPQLELKEDVPGQWDSTFEMLERFNLIEGPIICTLSLIGFSHNLTLEQWNVINYCTEVLRAFKNVLQEITSEDKVTLSKTSILLRYLITHMKEYLQIEELPQEAVLFGNGLLDGLSKRFKGIEDVEFVSQAIFLDPRFKRIGFEAESKYQNTYRTVVAKAQEISINKPQYCRSFEDVPTSSVWKAFDERIHNSSREHSAVSEVDCYVAEPYLKRTEDPLLWWENKKSMYPNLYILAHKILCIPATSLFSERIFLKRHTQKTLLNINKLSQILFISNNA